MVKTKEEAITMIIERMAVNEEAANGLLDAIAAHPETVASNPLISIAVLRMVSVRMESAKIFEEARKVLEDGN